jgi:CRISPR-associated protein Cmr4
MNQKLLYLFTRTPLHVGAGASVGAIDQPISRERHTGFPNVPASSLKGTFADAWNDGLHEQFGKKHLRVTTMMAGDKEVLAEKSDAAWLFGSDNASHAFAGAVQFAEARLLAFPIRSAKGCFAWITCKLMLERAARDGLIQQELVKAITEPSDDQAFYAAGNGSKLDLGNRIVLEEYTFTLAGGIPVTNGTNVATALAGLIDEPLWKQIDGRLVILSDGMMSFFATAACEVAQHVRISDETGTADGGGLFNQENVPAETLFYSVVRFSKGTGPFSAKSPSEAATAFDDKFTAVDHIFQFGADATTGLGYCTVSLKEPVPAATPPAATTSI